MTHNRQPTLADLSRVHVLASERFPHEYLDSGLNAIGLFLQEPPSNAGYQQTPINSISFAGIGVHGVHFGILTDDDVWDPMAPVVMTIPMAHGNPNFIVGENLRDFLCLGCEHGYADLGNLHLDAGATLGQYDGPPPEFYDERSSGILELLRHELSLTRWGDVPGHFAELQIRFKGHVRMQTRSQQGEG